MVRLIRVEEIKADITVQYINLGQWSWSEMRPIFSEDITRCVPAPQNHTKRIGNTLHSLVISVAEKQTWSIYLFSVDKLFLYKWTMSFCLFPSRHTWFYY